MQWSAINSGAKMSLIMGATAGVLGGIAIGSVAEAKTDKHPMTTNLLAGVAVGGIGFSAAKFASMGYDGGSKPLIGVGLLAGVGVGAGIAAAIAGVASMTD